MFGYVRARQDTLSCEAQRAYEAVYCGLCRSLGARYGGVSRLFLNYDFAFLAMLLAPVDAVGACGRRRCPAHPIEGREDCGGGAWLELAGAESVVLAYWKLRDSAADEGFLRGLPARGLSRLLGPAYRQARENCPGFDSQVRELLDELGELEREGCPSIDRTADCFARLLKAAAPETGEQGRDRALGELLYHVGRWIYLVDAVDDLAEDKERGRFNPAAARFPAWNEEDKSYLRRTMDHSLTLAGAAFQLLEANPWTPVVENILYSGLPGVEELVFSGQWREYQKKHRRNG